MAPSEIPTTAPRGTLASSIHDFLRAHPDLHLGGADPFTAERAHHLHVFGIHNLPRDKLHTIGTVEFTAIRGPHGTIPLRILYPYSASKGWTEGKAAALVYMHGGGYTVGSVDEFENGLRLLAEEGRVVVVAVEYRLAPEWQYPTQLDEYDAVVDEVMGRFGEERGIDAGKVLGGGDSAGGNMTAALALRRMDRGKRPLKAQVLVYPEARVPFDTPAATENNTGYYLECNGIFSFADHYLPRGVPPAERYVSPGMQPVEKLAGQPAAVVATSGFDPLRDVGVEYARKLDEAGVRVQWRHWKDLTHGWLQMTAWSEEAVAAVTQLARDVKMVAYEKQ